MIRLLNKLFPNRKYLLILFILFLLIYFQDAFWFGSGMKTLFVFYAFAFLFSFTYFLRFESKENKSLIEYLKLVTAFCYGFSFPIAIIADSFTIPSAGVSYLANYIRIISLFMAFIILLFDRYYLNPNTMKRKLIIALVVQSVFVFLCFLFAFAQKVKADQNAAEALLSRQQAKEIHDMLDKTRTELDECRKVK